MEIDIYWCLIHLSSERLHPPSDGNKFIPTARHYAETGTLEHTTLNEMTLSNPSLQSSGNPEEEEVEGVGETEETKDTRRMRPSKMAEQRSYELAETEAGSTGPVGEW